MNNLSILVILGIFGTLLFLEENRETTLLVCKNQEQITYVGNKSDYSLLKLHLQPVKWVCSEKTLTRSAWRDIKSALDRSHIPRTYK